MEPRLKLFERILVFYFNMKPRLNAHFNNKGYTSIHKSLQKLKFLKIFAVEHTIIAFLTF